MNKEMRLSIREIETNDIEKIVTYFGVIFVSQK